MGRETIWLVSLTKVEFTFRFRLLYGEKSTDIMLSIDIDVQRVAEENIVRAVEDYQAGPQVKNIPIAV